jgi:murein DD-endopeptidase MepM/ murein hydrolase activator NlpD
MKSIILFLVLALYVFNFTGCVPSPYVKPAVPVSGMPGIYHRVEKGQTLWRISKIYDLDLDEIVRVNHIPDAANIEVGQLIFIPSKLTEARSMPDRHSSVEDFIWPLKGKVTVSFGQPFNNMVNKGINIQSNSSDVAASRSGKVIFFNEHFGGFGKTIIIDHGDGFSTVYAMNSEVFIKIGDYLQKGDLLGKANNLHFEIRKGHVAQNPLFYLP